MRNARVLPLAGFGILILTVSALFYANFLEALSYDRFVLLTAINLAALAGIGYQCRLEFNNIINLKFPFKLNRGDAADFLSVVAGTALTFHASAALELGPVVAAGIVGMTASVILPRRSAPAYCGAFVGMSCPIAFSCSNCLLLAASIAGALFVISKNTLNGFGGKLGTIAFFGAVSTLFLFGRAGAPGISPGLSVKLHVIFYSVLAAIITFIISIKLGKGPVFASALVGLLGGLLLPGVYPEFGALLGVIVICASFAGMSSPERITTNLQMLLAGALTGVFFIFTLAHFPGAGGKLGAVAFISTLAISGCAAIRRKIKHVLPGREIKNKPL